jgi:alpha-glucosidase (family GH31 glycosyl hydrolase)
MILSFGLSGISFSGVDVGEFFESPGATLFVGWIQLGAWYCPFFRVRCYHNSEIREIYVMKGCFFEAATIAIQESINFFHFSIFFQEMQI